MKLVRLLVIPTEVTPINLTSGSPRGVREFLPAVCERSGGLFESVVTLSLFGPVRVYLTSSEDLGVKVTLP